MTETPEEKCEIKSHKFCQPIYVLVPYIESEEACKNVEQEFCELRRINPTKVMKQKLKKYCTKMRPPKKWNIPKEKKNLIAKSSRKSNLIFIVLHEKYMFINFI